jgi:hypothetical protein
MHNLVATYLAANHVFHARMNHIEIDFHFIREKVKRKELNVQFTTSKEQSTYILTKPLSTRRFESIQTKLNLTSREMSLWEDVKHDSDPQGRHNLVPRDPHYP